MTLTPSQGLGIARQVVAEASRLLVSAGGKVGTISTKTNLRDLVTEWDTRSEELIRERLSELAPGVPMLGEEGGATGDDSSAQKWLIDPIDGTVNFAHGIPLYSVTVALEEHGSPIAGVVTAPALGWEFYAHRGGGAFLVGGPGGGSEAEPIHVSSLASIEGAILASGFPYDRATTGHNFEEWEHFQRTAGACRRFGAASLDLCMVARGWLDGYWETRLNPWDLSAGALIVEEAGGTVTNITGGPFLSASGNAVASNGAIHAKILTELQVAQARRTPSHD